MIGGVLPTYALPDTPVRGFRPNPSSSKVRERHLAQKKQYWGPPGTVLIVIQRYCRSEAYVMFWISDFRGKNVPVKINSRNENDNLDWYVRQTRKKREKITKHKDKLQEISSTRTYSIKSTSYEAGHPTYYRINHCNTNEAFRVDGSGPRRALYVWRPWPVAEIHLSRAMPSIIFVAVWCMIATCDNTKQFRRRVFSRMSAKKGYIRHTRDICLSGENTAAPRFVYSGV